MEDVEKKQKNRKQPLKKETLNKEKNLKKNTPYLKFPYLRSFGRSGSMRDGLSAVQKKIAPSACGSFLREACMLPHVPYLHRDMTAESPDVSSSHGDARLHAHQQPWCVCPQKKKPQEHRVTAPNKSSGNGTRSGLGKKKKVSLSVGHSVSPCAQSDQTPLVGVSRGFAAWMMTPFWICQ